MSSDNGRPFDILDETTFDLIVVGTSLASCMLSGAASLLGKKVLHLDYAERYGGEHSTLTLGEVEEFAGASSTSPSLAFSRVSMRPAQVPQEIAARKYGYHLDVHPVLLFARSPTTRALAQSGVSRYLDFRIVPEEWVHVEGSGFERVPSKKENVFASKSLSLIEKRILMRVLTAAVDFDPLAVGLTPPPSDPTQRVDGASPLQAPVGEGNPPFSEYLTQQKATRPLIRHSLLEAATLTTSVDAISTHAALSRIQARLHSRGRFSQSGIVGSDVATLIAPIGGAADFPQAFSRLAAINGATFMLDTLPTALEVDPTGEQPVRLTLPSGQVVTAPLLSLEAVDLLPAPQEATCAPGRFRALCANALRPVATQQSHMHRAMIVADQPFSALFAPAVGSSEADDTAAISYEAPMDEGHMVRLVTIPAGDRPIAVLQTGQATLSSPADKYVYYISRQAPEDETISPEADLQDALSCIFHFEDLATSPAPAGRVAPLMAIFYRHSSATHDIQADGSPFVPGLAGQVALVDNSAGATHFCSEGSLVSANRAFYALFPDAPEGSFLRPELENVDIETLSAVRAEVMEQEAQDSRDAAAAAAAASTPDEQEGNPEQGQE